MRSLAPYRLVYFGWASNRCGRGSDCNPRSVKAWGDILGQYEVHELTLPGRGPRMEEAAATNAITLAHQIARELRGYLPADGKPLAFLGFAFGAILAHETIVELERGSTPGQPNPIPLLLCAISCEGPSWRGRRSEHHTKSEKQFVAELRQRGGTEEVLEVPELLKLFLPTMRADVALEERYRFDPDERPSRTTTVAVLVIRGGCPGPKKGDTLVSEESAALWRDSCSSDAVQVCTLDRTDWFMLESEQGATQALRAFDECFIGEHEWQRAHGKR